MSRVFPILEGMMSDVLAKAGCMLAIGMLLVEPAVAAPDFNGKIMSLLVGTNSGGGNDAYARLLAKHMPTYLPGHPTIVVKTMPGGGGLVAANTLYSTAPRDGLTIGLVAKTIPFEPYLGNKAAQYNPLEFTWLGTASSYGNDAYVLAVRADSPYQTIEDLQKPGKPAFFGGTAKSSLSTDAMVLAKNVFNLNMEIVRGYNGTSAIALAMSRGEVQGFSTGMSAVRQSYASMLEKGELRVLLQFGHETRWPGLPDVPTAMELAKTQEAQDMVSLLEIPFRVSRPYVAPPGLPPEIAGVLKSAFMAAQKDPEYLAGAEKLQLDISPLDGDEIHRVVERFAQIPPALIEKYNVLTAEPK